MSGAVLETARLRLRPIDQRDAALYRALYTSPLVMHRIMPPLSQEAADLAFGHACRHNTRFSPGHRFWSIQHRNASVGMGLAALLRKDSHAELGVLLLPAHWKTGVSSDAFVALLDHAFAAMGLDLIHAQRLDDDHALVIDRLLGPLGFVRVPPAGVTAGTCRWELRRSDWKRAPTPGPL